jgi:hypothetical protein
MNNFLGFGLFICCLLLIFGSLEQERKMEYQRGQIEGLQTQLEHSQPNVNVTQNNRNSGMTGVQH